MAVVKFGGTGNEVIKAKAGQNILPALGVECLSWIRVITKKPEGLTIIASIGATHYTTKKTTNMASTRQRKRPSAHPWVLELTAPSQVLLSTRMSRLSFTFKVERGGFDVRL